MTWTADAKGNLAGPQGDTGSFYVVPTDNAGDPYDPADHDARWHVYESGSDTPLLDKHSDGGGITVSADPEGGADVWLVTVSPADTAGLAKGLYRHEFKSKDPAGRVVQQVSRSYRVQSSSIKENV